MKSVSKETFKQRTAGEWGEKTLINSLAFSGLMTVNWTIQVCVGLYVSLVTPVSQAFLSLGRGTLCQAMEHYYRETWGSEQDRKTAHEELEQWLLVPQDNSSSEGWDVVSEVFLSCSCYLHLLLLLFLLHLGSCFNMPLDRCYVWVWRSTLIFAGCFTSVCLTFLIYNRWKWIVSTLNEFCED